MDNPQNRACPVCNWILDHYWDDAGRIGMDCELCGRYTITGLLFRAISHPDCGPFLPALAIYIRQANDAGAEVHLTTENFRELAESVRGRQSRGRTKRLLELIANGSRLGEWVNFSDGAPRHLLQRRVGLETQGELEFLFQALVQSQDITCGQRDDEIRAGTLLPFGIDPLRWRVTPKGWAELEADNAVGAKAHCFVAMSFAPTLEEAFVKGIAPAIETDCGLVARRVDRIEHIDSINDRIIAEMRGAGCAVTDFSGQRAGVYFEAGFMLGLGRPVVWTCHADDLENLHFDTRHYPFIVWQDPSDLRQRLTRRLRALGLARRLE